MTANSIWVGTPSMLMALRSTCMRAVPRMTPSTAPSPPRKLKPPSTAAAIAYSS